MSGAHLPADQLHDDGLLLARRFLRELADDGPMPPSPDDLAQIIALAWAHGRSVEVNTRLGRHTCRVCGCWQLSACVVGGRPCHWAAPNLCSACAPATSPALQVAGALEAAAHG